MNAGPGLVSNTNQDPGHTRMRRPTLPIFDSLSETLLTLPFVAFVEFRSVHLRGLSAAPVTSGGLRPPPVRRD